MTFYKTPSYWRALDVLQLAYDRGYIGPHELWDHIRRLKLKFVLEQL